MSNTSGNFWQDRDFKGLRIYSTGDCSPQWFVPWVGFSWDLCVSSVSVSSFWFLRLLWSSHCTFIFTFIASCTVLLEVQCLVSFLWNLGGSLPTILALSIPRGWWMTYCQWRQWSNTPESFHEWHESQGTKSLSGISEAGSQETSS